MATALKLRSDIKKLKKAIETKGISAPIKQKLKSQLEKAENELATLKSTGKAPKKSSVAGTKTALTSLQKLVNRKKFSVYQGKGVDLKRDAGEGAMATGRRVSKGLKSNQYGSKGSNKGNVYYEYRPNRLDVKQPKGRQKYPKLEDGGIMADGGKLANGKYKYEKGDEGMFMGDEVRVVKLHNGFQQYEYDIIDEEGKVKSYGAAKKEKFENQFRYFPKMAEGGYMADGGDVKSKFGYVAMYKGKRVELYADSKYQAQLKAAQMLGAKKSYDVSVYLAEVDGKPYVNTLMADGGYVVINKGGDRYDGGIFYQIKKGDEIVKQGLIDGDEMVEFDGKKYDGLKSLAEGIGAELKIEEMKYGGQMAEGGEIKKGDYVIVDNPVWKAALGNDKPVRRKVKMVIDTDVVFHDGSISQLKYVKKMEDGGVISNTHKID